MLDEQEPLVSVIIPVYNVKSYLREALDSVINQTYTNLEIIIIDDGSSDGSGEVCDDYATQDARIISIHVRNQGLSAARNIGLDNMTGQYLMFLDPDDAFCPNTIELMIRAARDIDMAICKYNSINSEHHLESIGISRPPIQAGKYNRKEIFHAVVDEQLNIAVWNKMYRSELWKEIRFPVGKVYEDWFVIFPVFDRIRNARIISEVLYLHRIHSGSISMTPSLNKLNDWIENYRVFQHFVEQHIPCYFTVEHAKKTQERNVFRMIEQYVKCDKKDELRQFRRRILEIADGVKLRRIRIWLAYKMLCYCPKTLRMLYRIFFAL